MKTPHTNQFQVKLKRQIFLYGSTLVAVLLIALAGYMFLYKTYETQTNLQNANQVAVRKVQTVISSYRDQLQSISNQTQLQLFLKQEVPSTTIYQQYYHFNNRSQVKHHMLVTDQNNTVKLSTFSSTEHQILLFLNQTLAGKLKKGKIVTSAFPLQLDQTAISYIMGSAIYHQSDVIGYVFYYLSADDLNQLLMYEKIGHNIINDWKGTIIGTTNPQMANAHLRFQPKGREVTLYDVVYQIKHQQLAAPEIHVYSLVHSPIDMETYLFWFTIIILFGCILIIFSNYFASKIANSQSKSIASLLEAVEYIKAGNLDYRVHLRTQDEFETLANQFNAMLDEVNELNKHNVELVNVRRITEIKQLEAQFNPHLIYNTLDTIRYGMMLDPKLASDLIVKLTRILRYSVNTQMSVVTLEDDLVYIRDFLAIQSYRFADRFQYEIAVDLNCYGCKVPKLVLQPLIENSCKYGFIHQDALHIKIKGYIKQEFMYLSVEDNGKGMEETVLKELLVSIQQEHNGTEHIGLHNIKRRLTLLFGKDCDMILESQVGVGTKVTLKIALGGETRV